MSCVLESRERFCDHVIFRGGQKILIGQQIMRHRLHFIILMTNLAMMKEFNSNGFMNEKGAALL